MLPTAPEAPEASTYVRNALPVAGKTAASDTVTPAGRLEKIARKAGVMLPEAGGSGLSQTAPSPPFPL